MENKGEVIVSKVVEDIRKTYSEMTFTPIVDNPTEGVVNAILHSTSRAYPGFDELFEIKGISNFDPKEGVIRFVIIDKETDKPISMGEMVDKYNEHFRK